MRAMHQAYPSNLTLEQFELLRPLIPPGKPGGRPRSVDVWHILNAIFYVLCEDAAGGHCRMSFPTGKRFTPIFGTGASMELG